MNADTMSVLLKKPIFEQVSNRELVTQLEARKKSQYKLPTWFNSQQIYYPNKLHIEQTSSEITATYKATLVSGNTLLDLTGGLGIDSYFFSKKMTAVLHCEIDDTLSQIAAHNFKVLGAKNIRLVSTDGVSYLENQNQTFDWLYIDPSRRDINKAKVFQLADCIPNVSEHLDLFFEKSDNIMVKTAPLLDITKGISELQEVFEIHIVAIKNEVKELLWILKKGFKGSTKVYTINFQKKERQEFAFTIGDENNTNTAYSAPQIYLYEPNAALMKSGAFKTIAKKYNLSKLHKHTHLYTSEQLVDFPGRCFKVLDVFPYKQKSIKKLGIKKANITTRNFPHQVVALRKNLNIKDGGETYLFFTTDFEENLMVISCEKTKTKIV